MTRSQESLLDPDLDADRLQPDPESHPSIAERGAGAAWQTMTYGEVEQSALAVGEALLSRRRRPDRPLMILSGNSVQTRGRACPSGDARRPVTRSPRLVGRRDGNGQSRDGLTFAVLDLTASRDL